MSARHVLLVVVSVWFALSASLARSGHSENPAIQRLSDRSLKVRLQAAILMGNQRVVLAAPALRRLLITEQEHAAVRAAAAASLGRLGDETSRPRLVRLLGHRNRLLARAAERALMLLDNRLGKPAYLVSVSRPGLPAGQPEERADKMMKFLHRALEHTGGLVPGFGEERVLTGEELKSHLYRRGLRGVLLEPELVDLRTTVDNGSSRVFGTARIRVLNLVDRTTEFVGTGEADAWVEDDQDSDHERIMLESQALTEATDAAWTEVLDFLSAP